MTRITRWLSNEFATFTIETEVSIIVDAAPIAKRFKGQHFMNLVHWMNSKGGPTTIKILSQENKDDTVS